MNRNFLAVKKEFTTKAKCKSLIKTLDKNLKVDKSNRNLNNLNQVNLLTNGIPNTVINIQAECWLFNYI